MKKTHVLLLCILVLFMSCSNNGYDNDDVIHGSNEKAIFPDQFNSFHSNDVFLQTDTTLWISETRSPNTTKNIYGITRKKFLGTSKAFISVNNGWTTDKRIVSAAYICYHYHYIKEIEIPKGATLILPPGEIMKNLVMGANPAGGNQRGFAAAKIATRGDYDVYQLVTGVVEITHDLAGRLVYIPPVYDPQILTSSSEKEAQGKINFKYQYQVDLSWD